MEPLSFYQKLLGILILITIVFFSLFHITEAPPYQVDEGWAIQVADNIAGTGFDGLQFAPGDVEHVSVLTSVGYPLLYPLALWLKIFGTGVLQSRLMMVVYMLAFVTVSFMLLRRLYGNTIALSALALLSTFPAFFAFGKRVIGEVPVLFFMMLFLLLFDLAMHNQKRRGLLIILAGIAAGLCIVTKTMALAFIPVLIIFALLAWKKGLVSWKEIGIMGISAIIPIALWIMVNFQPGDSVASALDYYTNPSALTDKSATFWLNLRMFVSGIGPLYMLSLIAIWIIGVAIRLKTMMKVGLEESVALIFTLTLTASLLFRYWDARYLFPIQALGILFAPYSAYLIIRALPVKLGHAVKDRIFFFVIILMSIAGLYQLAFHSYIAKSYSSTYTRDLSEYFSSIPASASVLFYNVPTAVPFFTGRNYYQRIAMFEKWVLGPEFAPIADSAEVDILAIEAMSKDDEKVSLEKYEKITQIGEVSIFKRKTK